MTEAKQREKRRGEERREEMRREDREWGRGEERKLNL